MLAPTRAIAGLMPVSAKDEPITISLEINKIEEMVRLRVYAPRWTAIPQSAQNCRELAFRHFFLHRIWTEFMRLVDSYWEPGLYRV